MIKILNLVKTSGIFWLWFIFTNRSTASLLTHLYKLFFLFSFYIIKKHKSIFTIWLQCVFFLYIIFFCRSLSRKTALWPHWRGQVRHCKNQQCGSEVCRDSRMILLQLINLPSIFYLSERSCRKVDWLSLGELGFVFHSVFCSEQMYSYMYIQFRS